MKRICLSLIGILVFLIVLLPGCGGGTRGTGGIDFNGQVVSLKGAPLPNVVVTVSQSGDETRTDEQGLFSVNSSVNPGEVSLIVTTSAFSGEVPVGVVTEQTSSLKVKIIVDEDNEKLESSEIETDENENSNDDSDRKTPNPKPTRTPSHPTPTHQNGSVVPPTEIPAVIPTIENSPSPTSSPSGGVTTPSPTLLPDLTPTTYYTPTKTPRPTETIQNGEDAEAEGSVQNISTSSITVRGRVFQIITTTRFVNESGNNISPSLVVVGSEVHVKGKWQNGERVAQRIELKNDD